jgi:hypothetical protein
VLPIALRASLPTVLPTSLPTDLPTVLPSLANSCPDARAYIDSDRHRDVSAISYAIGAANIYTDRHADIDANKNTFEAAIIGSDPGADEHADSICQPAFPTSMPTAASSSSSSAFLLPVTYIILIYHLSCAMLMNLRWRILLKIEIRIPIFIL